MNDELSFTSTIDRDSRIELRKEGYIRAHTLEESASIDSPESHPSTTNAYPTSEPEADAIFLRVPAMPRNREKVYPASAVLLHPNLHLRDLTLLRISSQSVTAA